MALSEVLHFKQFPTTQHSAQNIADWLTSALEEESLPLKAVSGVTPDGAADGQAALRLIHSLGKKPTRATYMSCSERYCFPLDSQVSQVRTQKRRHCCVHTGVLCS